ncbi:MAG: hypothetical protein ACOVOQ_07325 [Flavobacterium sp.]
MKQENLFGEEFENKIETQYTSKINIPNYEPRNQITHIGELFDNMKTVRLSVEIKNSNVSDEEKMFLLEAAKRHTVFNYEKIADYYAMASPEMQKLMERSALVIIDFNKAYENGYVKLAHEIANQYFDNYGK